MKFTPAEVRKAVVAVVGAAAQAVNLGLVHGTPAQWVGIVIAVATALGVYAVPNGSKPAAPAPVPDPASSPKVVATGTVPIVGPPATADQGGTVATAISDPPNPPVPPAVTPPA